MEPTVQERKPTVRQQRPTAQTHGPTGRPSGPANGTPERVAVIGGGIAGLACSHYLSKAGAHVTLFEASDQFGGLGTFFHYRDTCLEKFYHCMLPGDDHLMSLLGDLGIQDRVYWRTAEFGFMHNGKLFGLNTPLELLAFKPLSFISRIRVGVAALYMSYIPSTGLDNVSAEKWLTRLCGRKAFELFWKPMFQAKFGDSYHEVPALWLWTRFNREKGTKKEVKGYIRGGYRYLTDMLVGSLSSRGAVLRLNAPVHSLSLDAQGRPVVRDHESSYTFDRVVVTTPLAHLRTFSGNGTMAPWIRRVRPDIDYQGVVNVVLVLRRGLTPYYWVAAMDGQSPFQGIVESSVLLESEDTGGHHLVYLMNYLHRTDPRFNAPDEQIINKAVQGLRALFPDLEESDIIDRFVFRAPFVEPLYTLGYLAKKPPEELVKGRVYLATASQVYPAVTSWNSSVGLAQRVSTQVLQTAQEKGPWSEPRS